ncbi:MAG: type II toxin-antitoxin system RelE family toxin [Nitrospiria bacterium]
MPYRLEYHPDTDSDFKRLDPPVRKKILREIDKKLGSNPEAYGKPLTSKLKGLWKLRVGDYRVIYQIRKAGQTVFILKIGHRQAVYE